MELLCPWWTPKADVILGLWLQAHGRRHYKRIIRVGQRSYWIEDD